MTSRRGFIGGLGLLVAAPAIVRIDNLMKLSRTPIAWDREAWEAQYMLVQLEEYQKKVVQWLLYGNPDVAPNTFQGFAPFYDTPNPLHR